MDYEELTNNDLIKRCAEDPIDDLAWKEFVRRFDKPIWLMVMRQSRQKHLHEDFVQSVYNRLVQGDRKALRGFRGPTENAIYKFLAVTARNVIKTHFIRKKAIKRRGDEDPLDKPVPSSPGDEGMRRIIDIISDPNGYDPEEKLNVEDMWRTIGSYLNQSLTGRDKERNIEIFRLFLDEELSAEEVGTRVGLAPQRVRNIITDCRNRLREGGIKIFW